jgi:hypothetical protein
VKYFNGMKIQLWETKATSPPKKGDKKLALIGDGSTDRLALRAESRPIPYYDSVVRRENNHLQNTDSHFPEDESGPSWTTHWVREKSEY